MRGSDPIQPPGVLGFIPIALGIRKKKKRKERERKQVDILEKKFWFALRAWATVLVDD